MCELMKVQNGCNLQAEKLEKVARTLNLNEVAYFSVLFSISFFYSCEPAFLLAAFLYDLSVYELHCLKINYYKRQGLK